MTTKEALRDAVDRMSEDEAERWLEQLNPEVDTNPEHYLTPDGRINHMKLVRLPIPARREVMRAFTAEVDTELLAKLEVRRRPNR